MPDTQQIIDTLEIAALNMGVSIGRDIAIKDAMTAAANQLKGVLQTQNTELENVKLQLTEKDATIETLTTALADNNIALPADTPVEAAPE